MAGSLSRSHIIETAISIADREGVSSLSMRKLARELDVQAMSLYHHVANKEAMIDAMVDAIFAKISMPETSSDWRHAMSKRAHSARDVLVAHSWAVGMLDSRRTPGPATLAHHDAVIACLRQAGFSIALAAHAFSALDSYIYGFVLQQVALPFETNEEFVEVAQEILAAMPSELYPSLAELAAHHLKTPGYVYADEFEFGLELVLDGLERRLAMDSSG